MFKSFLLICFSLFFWSINVLALELNLKDQAGVVNQEIKFSLLPSGGTPNYHYAIKDSNLPSTWRISDNMFYWTPKDSGFYIATFFVIDGNNNYAEILVRFSIIDAPFNDEKPPIEPSNDNFNLEKVDSITPVNQVKYLKNSMIEDEVFYQPISLHYTNGKMPMNATLTKDNYYAKLECKKGAKFTKNSFLFYSGSINPPRLISVQSARLKYNLDISPDVLAVVAFDLPSNVSVDGCYLVIDNYKASAYQTLPLTKTKPAQARAFNKPTRINLNGGLLVLLTNDIVSSNQDKKADSIENKISQIDNPYLKSLLSANLPKDLQNKNIKNGLTKAEMASLLIYTTTNDREEANNMAEKNLAYWGFNDVKAWEKYRGEIYQFKKLGYNQGIRNDFSPKSMATMNDLYFALAKPLNIKVNWWQQDTLKKELIKLNLINGGAELKENLTLERSAKAIFYTQEVLTKRGQAPFDKKASDILLAKRNNLIDDNLIYRCQKSGGISRADFLNLLNKKQNNEYNAFSVLKTQFLDKKEKIVIFDDIKVNNRNASDIAYAYTQGILPETWLKNSDFLPDKNINKAEALEIILKSIDRYNQAQLFYKKIAGKYTDFYDLENNEKMADKYFMAFYAKEENIIKTYKDRYGNELNLFLGEKAITLLDAIKMINSTEMQ